jgi:hypothetical protein
MNSPMRPMRIPPLGHPASFVVLVVALSAGCSNSATSPTAVARPDGVTIEGVLTLEEGETVPLSVRVHLSSGTSKAVAHGTVWTSGNPSIAVVSDVGVVTALMLGTVDIHASFEGLAASVPVTVHSGPRLFSGFVHESAPTEGIRIAAAVVAVVDAKGGTQSAVSDVAGRFSMRLPIGPARVMVTAAGYETTNASIDLGTNGLLSVGLLPVLREVHEEFGVAMDDWHGGPIAGAPLRQAGVMIVAHHSGTIRVKADACLFGCDASEMAWLCAEIRDSSNRVVVSARGSYDLSPDIPDFQTNGGDRYEVKMGVCSNAPADWSMLRYFIDVKHPS